MSVIARIVLRVIAGVLIGWGLPVELAEELAHDPELISSVTIGVETFYGTAAWALAEGYYWLAKRMGWRT